MKKNVLLMLFLALALLTASCGQTSTTDETAQTVTNDETMTNAENGINDESIANGETGINDESIANGETGINDESMTDSETTTGETTDNETVNVEQPVAPDNAGETITLVSIDPVDYGITETMLQEMPDFSGMSLEALGASFLHADGAMAESAEEEFYQRFMADPGAVLNYLSALGDQIARPDSTSSAMTELCRALAFADVLYYDATDEFSAILDEYRDFSEQTAPVMDSLQREYTSALTLYHTDSTQS